MHQLLQLYLRRLTNLSGNNRSLLMLRLSSDQCIDLQDLDFLNHKPAFSIIEQLISRKKAIELCQVMDSRDENNNLASRKLKKLQRIDRFIFEERGIKDLYVGWPFVRGKFSDGTIVRCPLMYFPVELEEKNNQWLLKTRKNVSITLNQTFLLAYAHYNQVKLDDELLDLTVDDWDSDSRVFRTSLYRIFRDSPVEINFNQENFLDQLVRFENFLKADFTEATKAGELKLFPEAVLGIFPQTGSHLVPDYAQLIDDDKINDLEEFFTSRSVQEDREAYAKHSQAFHFLQRVREEQFITPFALDAFQENALKAVKKGNSLVVQGPPGTGKSQFICNLMADYMAQGKRVLLVCQKRAALDVVYERMSKEEFGEYVGLVHDFRDDRRDLYDKIRRQVARVEEYKQLNNGLDVIHIEREFLQCSRQIEQITEELEEYKFALFDESECNKSVKELYLTSDIDSSHIELNQEYKYFTFDKMPEFVHRLRTYMQFAARFEREDYPWQNRKSFSAYTMADYKNIKKVIEEVQYVESLISNKVEDIIQVSLNYASLEVILSKKEQVEKMMELLSDEQTFEYFQHMLGYKDTSLQALRNLERILLDCYRGPGPEVTLFKHELGDFQEVLEKRLKAHSNFFRRILWFFNKTERHWVEEVYEKNGMQGTRNDTDQLIQKVDNRLNLEHNLTMLRDLGWVKDMPVITNKLEVQNWFRFQLRALEAKLIFNSLRNFKEYFNVPKLSLKEFKERLERLLLVLAEWPRAKQRWEKYLTSSQLSLILNDEKGFQKVLKVLRDDFDEICEFDRLKENLVEEEAKVIDKLFDEINAYDALQSEILFQNSIRLAWIEHIEIKYPVLRSVSAARLERLENELQAAIERKQELSKDIFLLKVREQTFQELEYNRLKNRVTYRDLLYQVNKKRKVWPLRKLIAHHGEELFRLMPAWLASPETVSAIFPMESQFDLVIFDEASQCFSEKGIPAMYRGKQVVVVGDEQQLKPNELYKVRWEEEEDDPAAEADSLLSLSAHYLMQVQLRGHYRSRSLELIDFSNQHFYEGQLQLIPDMRSLNDQEPAIRYIKTEGIWEKRTNPKEAGRVVQLIRELQESEPDKSIGIVTFNTYQQECIRDLLDIETAGNGLKLPDSLFVKNIENVQGDERDIIIFSIAYAPDAKGKMHMHFGSLNAAHGENRLNVAITRAKERIYVVSSILPEELKVEDAKNKGPKLLKEYLKYAKKVSDKAFSATLIDKNRYGMDWFLSHKLLEWSKGMKLELTLDDQIPFADLTLREEDLYDGLILTDDHLYHGAVSAKQPHAYLPMQLQEKNWRFRSYTSREYWFNRENLTDKITKFIRHVHD